MRNRLFLLLIIPILLCIGGASPQTELEILLQFKGNVTGDPHKFLATWAPGGDPCSFGGVFCNAEGRIERIVLWNTSLVGKLSAALSGLKSLRILTLFGNSFSGNIPQEYVALQSLWKINVSSNALSGSIPEFLGSLPNIRFLDLSKNGYVGRIPDSLFQNCYKTRFVSLSHNSLSGTIPDTIVNCANLEGFDFSYNQLSGGIPQRICEIPSLEFMSVRGNSLTGNVDEVISTCLSWNHLDLGSNGFTGLAPFSVIELSNISYFNISHNSFHGEVPELSECSASFEILDASWNMLDSEIPTSINRCGSLRFLDLGYNNMNGTIPPEIADLNKLLAIRLGNNFFDGTIPEELGGIQLLQVLDLQNLNLVGEIPSSLSNCQFLRELDLSVNQLVGGIPEKLYNMTYLEVLDLHQNHLNGSIPSTLGNLPRLQVLDLSHNSLSGSIPEALGYLANLTHFNVSFNMLSGSIPKSRFLQAFGPSAFSNNLGLCGSPLDLSCLAGGNATTTGKKNRVLSVSAIIAIVAAALILTGVCIVIVLNIRAQRRKPEAEPEIVESTPLGSTESNVIIGKLVLFSKSLPSKYEDWEVGTKALLDKDCLIGGGSIGSVYRANFEGGISIAVKKLETLGRIRSQDEFEQEIGRLGNLRHPNLVALQGYYWSSTMQLILTEYIMNGNLYDNLHGPSHSGPSARPRSSELDWTRRFRIAHGTSKALAYLHHDCQPPILHLNIKSRNILLDDNYEPKLSDYGLEKLLPIMDNYGLTKFHNAIGYVAPELAQGLRASQKCDVYSFGVILLELVTGRKPVETATSNEVIVLCEYVRRLLDRGIASDCFDGSLRGFSENELIQVMKLGLICTSEQPARRPSMAEVVQVLESIRSGPELM
ncbi:hypothetical protein MLD38_038484 [Melastoma candidum]|uniref:Uncharacterized protein n=1 Tax=Melastoma candidum TaxID=119954 RepID=A0ACB9KZP8_9MYRT|nr:hypothetical protein MLD38_038484 [Melastoma candidum]